MDNTKLLVIGTGTFKRTVFTNLQTMFYIHNKIPKAKNKIDIVDGGNPRLKECDDLFKDYDMILTASYGKIFPQELLNDHFIMNLHPSNLPDYWGASPLQRQLIDGVELSCVTLIRTNSVGVDMGDIILTKPFSLLSGYSPVQPYRLPLSLEEAYKVSAEVGAAAVFDAFTRSANEMQAKKIKPDELLLSDDDGVYNIRFVNGCGKKCRVPTRYGEEITIDVDKTMLYRHKLVPHGSGMPVGQLGDVVDMNCKELHVNNYMLCIGNADTAEPLEPAKIWIPITRVCVGGKRAVSPQDYINGCANKKEVVK